MESAPLPAPPTPEAIAAAEEEVSRCERAVLAARTEAEADRARTALTRAELALDILMEARDTGCGCEGWPRGK